MCMCVAPEQQAEQCVASARPKEVRPAAYLRHKIGQTAVSLAISVNFWVTFWPVLQSASASQSFGVSLVALSWIVALSFLESEVQTICLCSYSVAIL